MYDSCMGGSYAGMGFGWLFQILIFVAFFLIVWWVIKSNPNIGKKTEEKPIDIMRRRLANGEITKKKFEELKKELED
jgi:putative membrane protein